MRNRLPKPMLFAPALMIALLAIDCRRQPVFDSYVDVPTTLESARALHKPPDVDVKVERVIETSGGGGNCGHSAVCLIVLPLIVAAEIKDYFFPAIYDLVTITEHGTVTYTSR